MADVEFRRDLYRGTARDYERYRVPYPPELIADLAERSGADGRGRLLDLACGTGQIGFALHGSFREVWAVDQEPDMTRVVAQKARAAGITTIRAVTCAAEDLRAPEGSFDLVAAGNAFHRLPRRRAAASVFRWLRPGAWLALAWGGSPWDGEAAWQQAVSAVMARWRARVSDTGRIPPEYDMERREHPDVAILAGAGFETAGRYRFTAVHEWTPQTLAGFIFSTSVLSRAVLGGLAPALEADLRGELRAHAPGGRLRQQITFAYDLARRPL